MDDAQEVASGLVLESGNNPVTASNVKRNF